MSNISMVAGPVMCGYGMKAVDLSDTCWWSVAGGRMDSCSASYIRPYP